METNNKEEKIQINPISLFWTEWEFLFCSSFFIYFQPVFIVVLIYMMNNYFISFAYPIQDLYFS